MKRESCVKFISRSSYLCMDNCLHKKLYLKELLEIGLLFILLFFIAIGCSQKEPEKSEKPKNNSQDLTPKTEVQKLITGKIEWPPYYYLKDMIKNNGLVKENSQNISGGITEYDTLGNETFTISTYELNKIDYLLQNNVVRLYSLEDKYNTPLKKKMFHKSKNFQAKKDSLKILKEQFMSKTFYLNWKLENTRSKQSSNRVVYNNALRYDLGSNTFSVSETALTKKFFNEPYLIYSFYRTLIFKLPNGITKSSTSFESIYQKKIKSYQSPFNVKMPDTLRNRLREKYRPDGVRQDLKLKVKNENVALKIENNSTKIRLLFIFKIAGTVNNDEDVYLTDWWQADPPRYFISTKLNKIIIYNDATGKIYKEYQ